MKITTEERDAYLLSLTPEWRAEQDSKKIDKISKAIIQSYVLSFHKYVIKVYPHIRFDAGDDRIYWNYNEETGIYDELTSTTIKDKVRSLMLDEELILYINDSTINKIIGNIRSSQEMRYNISTYTDFTDANDWFHCKNGWVNLVTLEFEPHTPKRLSRSVSSVEYDPAATCPLYDKFLDEQVELAADAVRLIDQFSGYILTPSIAQGKMLVLVGDSGCGKSTIVDIWKYILGDFTSPISKLSMLDTNERFSGVSLADKLLVGFEESESIKKSQMSNALGNLITGPTIRVERKGVSEVVNVKNKVKCVLTCNKLPAHAEIGIFRRMMPISFYHIFENEGTEVFGFIEDLKKESSGIFNRMLRGLADLRKMRRFTMVAGMDEYIEEYKASSDAVSEFISEYFLPGTKEDKLPSRELRSAFIHFNSGTYKPTPESFARDVYRTPLKAFVKKLSSGRMPGGLRAIAGLKLKPEYIIIPAPFDSWKIVDVDSQEALLYARTDNIDF